MAGQKTMRIRTIGDITILQLHGQIRMNDGAEKLRSKVVELCEWGHKKILLNLDQVTSADTAGIEAVLDSYDLLARNGGCLKLTSPGNSIRYLLSMTKLEMGVDVHPTVGRAIASFP